MQFFFACVDQKKHQTNRKNKQTKMGQTQSATTPENQNIPMIEKTTDTNCLWKNPRKMKWPKALLCQQDKKLLTEDCDYQKSSAKNPTLFDAWVCPETGFVCTVRVLTERNEHPDVFLSSRNPLSDENITFDCIIPINVFLQHMRFQDGYTMIFLSSNYKPNPCFIPGDFTTHRKNFGKRFSGMH